VPLLAVLNAGVRSLLHETNPDPAEVDVLKDQAAQPNDAEPGSPKAEIATVGEAEADSSTAEPPKHDDKP
jgi:putative heme transporter